MPPKRELCRNFLRGSCRYGDRCKFLHAAPEQSTPSKTFGFGAQGASSFQGTSQQQQMQNPFGFGVQKDAHSRGNGDYAFNGPQKLFENKWTRQSPSTNNGSFTPKQNGNQPQAADHKCTDHELCKRLIVEDSKSEKPQWILSCYGHCRYGPCDITGDLSCEELRAMAYDDARSGKSLLSIIERERSLVNSKLDEFRSLVQRASAVSPSGEIGSSFPTMNSSSPAPAFSFTQFSQSQNTGTATATSFSFGQSSQFPNNNPSSNFVVNNSPFGKPGGFGAQTPQTFGQNGPFGTKNFVNASGAFGTQTPQISGQSNFSFGTKNFQYGQTAATANPFNFTPATIGSVENEQVAFASMLNSVPASNNKPIISMQLNTSTSSSNINEELWTKRDWKIDEIPEDAPPDIYVQFNED